MADWFIPTLLPEKILRLTFREVDAEFCLFYRTTQEYFGWCVIAAALPLAAWLLNRSRRAHPQIEISAMLYIRYKSQTIDYDPRSLSLMLMGCKDKGL